MSRLSEKLSEVVLPIELQIDKYHPDNSNFMQQVHRSKNLLVHQSNLCRAQHAKIVKGHFKGRSNVQLAADNNRSAATISNVLKRPECRQLLLQLHHHATLWDGPSVQLRVHMLHEISIDNQQTDPRTSIAAIAEMNKMSHVYNDKADVVLDITINNIAKGPLDGAGDND